VVAWTLGAWWINPELGDHRSRDHTMLYLGMGWPLIQLKSGCTSARPALTESFGGRRRRLLSVLIPGGHTLHGYSRFFRSAFVI